MLTQLGFPRFNQQKKYIFVFGSTREVGFSKIKTKFGFEGSAGFNQIIKGHQFGAEVFLRDKIMILTTLDLLDKTNYEL